MQRIRIGQLLNRIKESIVLVDDVSYKRVTIRTKNQGIALRDVQPGVNIGTKKQFLVRKGQFLLSKIDARNGAFGIVPEALDEAIITGNFWTFEVDEELLNIEWFNIFVSSPYFIDICSKASSGTTNRQYLDEKNFLNFEFPLPNLNEQEDFIRWYKSIRHKFEIVLRELATQYKNAQRLRNSLLQEAIQGKLVLHDPNDEAVDIMLEKIKVERLRLAQSEKEKQKLEGKFEELVIQSEIEGWLKIKAELICDIITKGTTPKANELLQIGDVPYLKVYNIVNNKIDFYYKPQFVSSEIHNKFLKRSRVYPNDVLMNIVGPPLGKVAIVPTDYPEWNINQALAIFRPVKYVMPQYLYLVLVEGKLIKDTQAVGTAGQDNLSLAQCRDFNIYIPPLNEQKRIVEKVNQLMILCDELEQNIEQSKQETEKLMKAVLQEAFTVKEEVLS
ncbi:restriction endonuclease subunit S [Priestia megaterium]|uniref:restriction endonuclease subunit S n=2 Tax=Priestia megaterium TaxID=1404 RepID=UPI00300093D6